VREGPLGSRRETTSLGYPQPLWLRHRKGARRQLIILRDGKKLLPLVTLEELRGRGGLSITWRLRAGLGSSHSFNLAASISRATAKSGYGASLTVSTSSAFHLHHICIIWR
jgi:hypothetical protein